MQFRTDYVGWRDALGWHVAAFDVPEPTPRGPRWQLDGSSGRDWSDDADLVAAALAADQSGSDGPGPAVQAALATMDQPVWRLRWMRSESWPHHGRGQPRLTTRRDIGYISARGAQLTAAPVSPGSPFRERIARLWTMVSAHKPKPDSARAIFRNDDPSVAVDTLDSVAALVRMHPFRLHDPGISMAPPSRRPTAAPVPTSTPNPRKRAPAASSRSARRRAETPPAPAQVADRRVAAWYAFSGLRSSPVIKDLTPKGDEAGEVLRLAQVAMGKELAGNGDVKPVTDYENLHELRFGDGWRVVFARFGDHRIALSAYSKSSGTTIGTTHGHRVASDRLRMYKQDAELGSRHHAFPGVPPRSLSLPPNRALS